MKRWILLGLVSVAILGGIVIDRILPSAIERGANSVQPHERHAVREAARALHATIPVVDLHADPLLWKRDLAVRSDRGHVDLPRLQAGGVALQVFAAVTKSPFGQNYQRNEANSDEITLLAMAQLWPFRTWTSRFERAVYQAEKLQDLDRRAGEAFRIIRSRRDLETLLEARRRGLTTVGGLFGIEGAHALEGDLSRLGQLYDLGLRVVGLTHFFDNRLGGSLHGVSGEGLSDFGRSVVEEADRRRMVIDVAHASPQMVRDVLALSSRPVMLSHGGFAGVCKTARNLDDELMKAIASAGGLIGVGFWEGAVCDISPQGVVESIRYGIELVGVDHIALGSDYDGTTAVLFDASELAVLSETMLDRGFSEDAIRRVMGENAIRFFLESLP